MLMVSCGLNTPSLLLRPSKVEPPDPERIASTLDTGLVTGHCSAPCTMGMAGRLGLVVGGSCLLPPGGVQRKRGRTASDVRRETRPEAEAGAHPRTTSRRTTARADESGEGGWGVLVRWCAELRLCHSSLFVDSLLEA